jgi:VanZ family protein
MGRFFLIAGWLTLLLVAVFTLSPLDARPEITMPHVERFAAFGLLGLTFALAYPQRLALTIFIVGASAVSLETLQLLTPDRHASLIDAVVKMSGGICGVTLGWLISCLSSVRISLSR